MASAFSFLRTTAGCIDVEVADGRGENCVPDALFDVDRACNIRYLLCQGSTLATLAGIKCLRKLWFLDISYSRVDSLTGLEHVSVLGTLDVRGTDIPFASLRSVLQRMHVFHLRIEGSLAAEQATRQRIIAALPKLWVLDGVFITSAETQQSCIAFPTERSNAVSTRRASLGATAGNDATSPARQSKLQSQRFVSLLDATGDWRRLDAESLGPECAELMASVGAEPADPRLRDGHRLRMAAHLYIGDQRRIGGCYDLPKAFLARRHLLRLMSRSATGTSSGAALSSVGASIGTASISGPVRGGSDHGDTLFTQPCMHLYLVQELDDSTLANMVAILGVMTSFPRLWERTTGGTSETHASPTHSSGGSTWDHSSTVVQAVAAPTVPHIKAAIIAALARGIVRCRMRAMITAAQAAVSASPPTKRTQTQMTATPGATFTHASESPCVTDGAMPSLANDHAVAAGTGARTAAAATGYVTHTARDLHVAPQCFVSASTPATLPPLHADIVAACQVSGKDLTGLTRVAADLAALPQFAVATWVYFALHSAHDRGAAVGGLPNSGSSLGTAASLLPRNCLDSHTAPGLIRSQQVALETLIREERTGLRYQLPFRSMQTSCANSVGDGSAVRSRPLTLRSNIGTACTATDTGGSGAGPGGRDVLGFHGDSLRSLSPSKSSNRLLSHAASGIMMTSGSESARQLARQPSWTTALPNQLRFAASGTGDSDGTTFIGTRTAIEPDSQAAGMSALFSPLRRSLSSQLLHSPSTHHSFNYPRDSLTGAPDTSRQLMSLPSVRISRDAEASSHTLETVTAEAAEKGDTTTQFWAACPATCVLQHCGVFTNNVMPGNHTVLFRRGLALLACVSPIAAPSYLNGSSFPTPTQIVLLQRYIQAAPETADRLAAVRGLSFEREDDVIAEAFRDSHLSGSMGGSRQTAKHSVRLAMGERRQAVYYRHLLLSAGVGEPEAAHVFQALMTGGQAGNGPGAASGRSRSETGKLALQRSTSNEVGGYLERLEESRGTAHGSHSSDDFESEGEEVVALYTSPDYRSDRNSHAGVVPHTPNNEVLRGRGSGSQPLTAGACASHTQPSSLGSEVYGAASRASALLSASLNSIFPVLPVLHRPLAESTHDAYKHTASTTRQGLLDVHASDAPGRVPVTGTTAGVPDTTGTERRDVRGALNGGLATASALAQVARQPSVAVRTTQQQVHSPGASKRHAVPVHTVPALLATSPSRIPQPAKNIITSGSSAAPDAKSKLLSRIAAKQREIAEARIAMRRLHAEYQASLRSEATRQSSLRDQCSQLRNERLLSKTMPITTGKVFLSVEGGIESANLLPPEGQCLVPPGGNTDEAGALTPIRVENPFSPTRHSPSADDGKETASGEAETTTIHLSGTSASDTGGASRKGAGILLSHKSNSIAAGVGVHAAASPTDGPPPLAGDYQYPINRVWRAACGGRTSTLTPSTMRNGIVGTHTGPSSVQTAHVTVGRCLPTAVPGAMAGVTSRVSARGHVLPHPRGSSLQCEAHGTEAHMRGAVHRSALATGIPQAGAASITRIPRAPCSGSTLSDPNTLAFLLFEDDDDDETREARRDGIVGYHDDAPTHPYGEDSSDTELDDEFSALRALLLQ